MLKNYYKGDSLYTELHKGDSFEIEPNSTMNLACCDCNLVHKLIFKILDNGNIGMKLKRNSRETAKKRKADLSKFIIGMSTHLQNKRGNKMETIDQNIDLSKFDVDVNSHFEKMLDAKTIYRDSNTNSDVDHIRWEKLDK